MKNDIEALRGFANDVYEYSNKHHIDGNTLFKFFLKYGLLTNRGHVTDLLTGSKDRIGDAQRRLYWVWLTDMSKNQVEAMKGRTKEDWHWEMKEKYLIPIFCRDDSEFSRMHQVYVRHMLYASFGDMDIIKEKFLGQLSITDATKEQATEYLKYIENFCWNNGIMLRTNEALYKLIFGK